MLGLCGGGADGGGEAEREKGRNGKWDKGDFA
jgi:hypothetical protein